MALECFKRLFSQKKPRKIQLTEEEELQYYEALKNQSSCSFFPENGPILLQSLGSRENDEEEATRRVKEFFKTTACFQYDRKRGCGVHDSKFSFTRLSYECHFWKEEYSHSHDGECIRASWGSIERISPKEFYNPRDRDRAHSGSELWAPGHLYKGTETYDRRWQVPEELQYPDEERYYLDHNKYRAKNFLGMVGYFEISSNWIDG